MVLFEFHYRLTSFRSWLRITELDFLPKKMHASSSETSSTFPGIKWSHYFFRALDPCTTRLGDGKMIFLVLYIAPQILNCVSAVAFRYHFIFDWHVRGMLAVRCPLRSILT